MKKQHLFAQKIINWYQKNARDLPFRKTRDPYKIWISEVMLQQTTMNAVIPYYKRWVKALPTVQTVAKTPLKKILRLWQGLGYYSRAKNIHKSAKIITCEFNGRIPQSAQLLQKLPGFGPYTIGAVLSIAYGKPHVIIDANVRRVVMRLLAMKGFAKISKDRKILRFLQKIKPESHISYFNQGLMELGALICRNREPLCALCPLMNFCLAYQKGVQEIIPKPKKKVITKVLAVVALIRKNGKYLIQKRPSKGLLADLWEFPGGKIEKNETAENALKREIKEELGCRVSKCSEFMRLEHCYTQFRVKLTVFDCTLKTYPQTSHARRWVNLRELFHYPMPSASVKILNQLTTSHK